MQNKEESLNALTTIYTTILQEIIHYSNEADNEGGKLINACIPVVTIFVGLNIFSDVFTESYLQMTIIIVILLFFFALYSIAQRSFQGHTYVALLRRQASILEYEINKRLGDEEGKYPILYNHEYISRYIAARQQMDLKIGNRIIKSSHITCFIFLLTLCLVLGVFFVLLPIDIWLKVLCCLCCLGIIFFFLKKFFNKYDNNELIRNGHYDDIESYRKDRKKSERESASKSHSLKYEE